MGTPDERNGGRTQRWDSPQLASPALRGRPGRRRPLHLATAQTGKLCSQKVNGDQESASFHRARRAAVPGDQREKLAAPPRRRGAGQQREVATESTRAIGCHATTTQTRRVLRGFGGATGDSAPPRGNLGEFLPLTLIVPPLAPPSPLQHPPVAAQQPSSASSDSRPRALYRTVRAVTGILLTTETLRRAGQEHLYPAVFSARVRPSPSVESLQPA